MRLEAGEILPDPLRDCDREQAAIQTVLEYFPVMAAEGTFYSEKTDDAAFHILNTGLDELLALGEVQTTDRFRRLWNPYCSQSFGGRFPEQRPSGAYHFRRQPHQ